MTTQKFLSQITSALNDLRIPYIVAGGLAVSVWGRPRHTADVDIVVEIESADQTKELISELKKIFPNAYSDEDMAVNAYNRKSEFNLIEPEYGLKADFFVSSGEEFKKSEMKRGKLKNIDGKMIRFISPEDLIISKLLWFREGQSTRQLEDIVSVINVQKSIDHQYLNSWVNKLKLKPEWQLLLQLLDKNR